MMNFERFFILLECQNRESIERNGINNIQEDGRREGIFLKYEFGHVPRDFTD